MLAPWEGVPGLGLRDAAPSREGRGCAAGAQTPGGCWGTQLRWPQRGPGWEGWLRVAPVPTSASVRVRSLGSSVTRGCVTHGPGSGSQDFTNQIRATLGTGVKNCVTERGKVPRPRLCLRGASTGVGVGSHRRPTCRGVRLARRCGVFPRPRLGCQSGVGAGARILGPGNARGPHRRQGLGCCWHRGKARFCSGSSCGAGTLIAKLPNISPERGLPIPAGGFLGGEGVWRLGSGGAWSGGKAMFPDERKTWLGETE